MSTDVRAQVTFMIREDRVEEMKEKARSLDEDNGFDAPEDYTVAQALQVVWHNEPEWLHNGGLIGWTLDKHSEAGGWKEVW